MSTETLNEYAEILAGSTTPTQEEEAVEEVVTEPAQEEEVEQEEEGEQESEDEIEEAATDEEEPESESEDLTNELPKDLSQLAEAFETDEDSIRNINVATKKDGSNVTLEQVLSNWDISEAVNRKSQEVSQVKTELDKERAYYNHEMQSKLQEQATVVQALEELYTTQGEAQLEELRETDPAEYAAMKADLGDQRNSLNTIKQQVQQDYAKMQQQQQAEYQRSLQQRLYHERELLIGKAPEFTNPKQFKKESDTISSFLTEQGFTKQEQESIVDHRVLLLARDAMRYKTMDATAKPKIKRAVKKPRNIRSGSAQGKKTVKEKSLAKTLATAKTSSDTRVKQDAIAQLLRSL